MIVLIAVVSDNCHSNRFSYLARPLWAECYSIIDVANLRAAQLLGSAYWQYETSGCKAFSDYFYALLKELKRCSKCNKRTERT
jgi:hypothetical protein